MGSRPFFGANCGAFLCAIGHSRFDRWKDPARVIEAFRKAAKEVDSTLVLCGNNALDDPEVGVIRPHGGRNRIWQPSGVPQEGVLQADLDAWLREYDESRPHQGCWCFGTTPMQTFLDAMPLAKEKMIAPNRIGHQNPIAQPGIACQIELRLMHSARVVASSALASPSTEEINQPAS